MIRLDRQIGLQAQVEWESAQMAFFAASRSGDDSARNEAYEAYDAALDRLDETMTHLLGEEWNECSECGGSVVVGDVFLHPCDCPEKTPEVLS